MRIIERGNEIFSDRTLCFQLAFYLLFFLPSIYFNHPYFHSLYCQRRYPERSASGNLLLEEGIRRKERSQAKSYKSPQVKIFANTWLKYEILFQLCAAELHVLFHEIYEYNP
jgi:hypothetical protein